jgi:hypothetical protein
MAQMSLLKRTLGTGVVVAVALAAFATSAAAFRLTIEEGGTITSASLGDVVFSAGIVGRCPMTLKGSFITTGITIAAGARIGSITEVRIDNPSCTGGSMRGVLVSSASPWSITISSVPAGMPNSVTALEVRINTIGIQWAVLGGFVNCLYSGSIPLNVALNRTGTAGTYTTGLLSVLTNTQALSSGGFGCPAGGEYSGTFGLSPTKLFIFV